MAGFGGFAGGIVGGGVVRLFLDSKQYYEGLAKADVAGKKATGSMGAGLSKFGMIATAIFATAALAAVKFGIDAVHAAEAHNVALAKLSIAARGNTEAFAALAQEQVKLTGYRLDDIIGAESNLAVLHLTENQMRQLLPLVEDYARFSGQDLPTAAGLIERAFLGNARAIKAVGIQYKATGDRAKDFKNITQAIASQIGGSAAAYLKTTAGQVELLRAQFDLMKIQVGEGLTPVFASLVRVGLSLMPIFQAVGFLILTVVGAIRLLTAAGLDLHASMTVWVSDILGFIGIGHKAAEQGGHLSRAWEDNKQMLDDYTTSVKGATGETGAYTSALQRSQAALKAQKDAQDALAGGLLGLIAQTRTVKQDELDLAGLRGGKLKDAQLRLLQDQLSLNDATKTYKDHLKTSGDTQKDSVRHLQDLGRQVGINKQQVIDLTGVWAGLWATINQTGGTGAAGLNLAIQRELRRHTAG